MQECTICGAPRESVEHVLFECPAYDSQRKNFYNCLKGVITKEAYDTFNSASVFDKSVFCLGEKQGLIVSDECSNWYNEVGSFMMSIWEVRKEILCGNGFPSGIVQTNPALECEANGSNAMVVDNE